MLLPVARDVSEVNFSFSWLNVRNPTKMLKPELNQVLNCEGLRKTQKLYRTVNIVTSDIRQPVVDNDDLL